MTDVLTLSQRSYNMSRIQGKNTKAELKLADAIKKIGNWKFKMHYGISGRPDFAFPSKKVAVFVDGCFWHKCPKCYTEPQSNRDFWLVKIERNVERDKEVNSVLKKNGWKVIRIWEHEINSGKAAGRILRALKK